MGLYVRIWDGGIGDFVVDPDGRISGLLLGWDKGVTIFQIRNTLFSIEIEFETSDSGGKI